MRRGTRATAIDEDLGDVIGYCSPTWASPYTYAGMLAFRGTAAAELRVVNRRVPALVVHGHVESAEVSLSPPLHASAPIEPEPLNAAWTITVRDDNGVELASRRFALGRFDHSDTILPFALSIPMPAEVAARATRFEVTGPTASRVFSAIDVRR